MQIAGTNCSVCQKNIAFEIEGLGCPDCEATYHNECLREDALCPKCQRNLNEAKGAMALEAQQEKKQVKHLHEAGKIALFSLIGIGFMLSRIVGVLTHDRPIVMCYPYVFVIVILIAGTVVPFWRALKNHRP